MTAAEVPVGFQSVQFIHFLSGEVGQGQKKALLMVRRALYMNLIWSSFLSDLSARIGGMELAPYHAVSVTGCQGFTGPLPSAFLDKKCKELAQR